MAKTEDTVREELIRPVFEEQHKQQALVRRSRGSVPHGHGRPGKPPALRQEHLLHVLKEHAGIRQKDLAELMHVRPQSLGELLDKVEDSGLLVRRRDPEDGRALLVELTEAGKTAEREHHKKVVETMNKRFGVLTDEELTVYLRLTKKINAALEESLVS